MQLVVYVAVSYFPQTLLSLWGYTDQGAQNLEACRAARGLGAEQAFDGLRLDFSLAILVSHLNKLTSSHIL